MQLDKVISHKSHYPLVFFGLIIISIMVLTELFQSPVLQQKEFKLYENPFSNEFLANVESIKYDNQLGSVTLGKTKEGFWQLREPRKMPAYQKTVDEIISVLKDLKIKKTYEYNTLTESDYSLKNPLCNIKLTTSNNTSETFNLGMINPINQSAYLSLGDKDIIYEIDVPQFGIQSFSITDFIEARIFTVAFNSLKKVRFFHGMRTGTPFFSLYENNGVWFTSRGRKVDMIAFEKYYQSLIETKTDMILDEIEESTQKTVDRLFEKPAFTLDLYDKENNRTTYTISQVSWRAIPELKIEKRQKIFIKASNKQYQFVLDKSKLKLFRARESNVSLKK